MTRPNVIEPLEGEAVIPGVTTEKPKRTNIRQMVAVAVLALSVMGVLGYTAVRHFAHRATPDAADKTAAPDVASGRVGKLDMTPPPSKANTAPALSAPASGVRVGEIDPDATPIPLRGAGAGGSGRAQKITSPEDARRLLGGCRA